KEAPGDHLGIGGTQGHTGKLIFFNGKTRNQILAGIHELPLRTWQHVVLVRKDRSVRVYLNGQLELEGVVEFTLPANQGNLFVGGRCDRFANFEGRVDEVAIYDRVLTPEEVSTHHALNNSTVQGK